MRTAAIVLLLAAAVPAAPAAGQAATTVELSFSNPGARSLGLGGAFVALADDATAAFANPAGLVQLVEPEVSVEGRAWSYSTPFTRSGRVLGLPTGIGIDTEPGIGRARSQADLSGLSFLSVVVPKRNWCFAFYRHQLANFEFALETQGLFASLGNALFRIPDRRGRTDLEITADAVSVGYRVSEDLSLGVGLSYFDVRLRLREDQYSFDENTFDSFFAENSFLPGRLVQSTEAASDDQDLGLTAGFLWRFSGLWSLGGFLRQAPEVDLEFGLVAGPDSRGPPPGTSIRGSAPFAFPDVYGIGIAYRSADGRVTASLEWDRVEYGTLFDSLKGLERVVEGVVVDDFVVDGSEIHMGAEYAFLASTPLLAVRFGVWHDPDHQFRSGSPDQPFDRALLPRGNGELHVAVGFGVKLERFQIDLGADFSDLRDTVAVSAIYSF